MDVASSLLKLQEINVLNLATITASNNAESSYAAVYDSSLGTYLSNEFTNNFIDVIDESPDINDTFKEHVNSCIF